MALAAVTLTSKEPVGAGSVRGTVTDPSGGVIPGDAVTRTGGARTDAVNTDESGEYRLSGLAPGHYKVAVRAKGFRDFEDPAIVVAPGQVSEGDAPLAIGQASQASHGDSGIDSVRAKLGPLLWLGPALLSAQNGPMSNSL